MRMISDTQRIGLEYSSDRGALRSSGNASSHSVAATVAKYTIRRFQISFQIYSCASAAGLGVLVGLEAILIRRDDLAVCP